MCSMVTAVSTCETTKACMLQPVVCQSARLRLAEQVNDQLLIVSNLCVLQVAVNAQLSSAGLESKLLGQWLFMSVLFS